MDIFDVVGIHSKIFHDFSFCFAPISSSFQSVFGKAKSLITASIRISWASVDYIECTLGLLADSQDIQNMIGGMLRQIYFQQIKI